MSEVNSSDTPRRLTRRRFLTAGPQRLAEAAGVLAVAAVATEKSWNRSPQEQPTQHISLTSPTPEAEEVKDVLNKTLLNEILALPPNSFERTKKEIEYLEELRTNLTDLKQLDAGFWAFSDQSNRAELLVKRWQLRQEGKFGLIKLSSEKEEWARLNRINPEVMAICEDNHPQAIDVMNKLQKTGIYNDNIDPEIRIMSPGGMAKLIDTESRGFIDIGKTPARNHFNSKEFEKEAEALQILAHFLSVDTGIEFHPNFIPGSERPTNDENDNDDNGGGAIGFQFLPSTAKEIYEELNKIGFKFNPFDLNSSVVGAWIYLASREYKSNSHKKMREALRGWNNHLVQSDSVFDKDLSYRNHFVPNEIQPPY